MSKRSVSPVGVRCVVLFVCGFLVACGAGPGADPPGSDQPAVAAKVKTIPTVVDGLGRPLGKFVTELTSYNLGYSDLGSPYGTITYPDSPLLLWKTNGHYYAAGVDGGYLHIFRGNLYYAGPGCAGRAYMAHEDRYHFFDTKIEVLTIVDASLRIEFGNDVNVPLHSVRTGVGNSAGLGVCFSSTETPGSTFYYDGTPPPGGVTEVTIVEPDSYGPTRGATWFAGNGGSSFWPPLSVVEMPKQ